MQSQIFTVKFVPNKTCFLYFTTKWTSSLQNLANAALQVIYNTNEKAYFSWSTNHSLMDNEVGINASFAKLLNIKEDDELLISVIKEVVKLKRIVVTPVSHDDWELLEMNAEIIQSTLLNYLTTVFINEKFLIWVSKSMSLCVQVDSLNPISQVGHLENFTEVEIIPIKSKPQPAEKQSISETNEWSWSKSFKNLVTKKNPVVRKSIDIFNKYNKLQFQFACNVRLIKNVDQLSVTDETKTILEHPFNVYIYKKHVPEFCSIEKNKFWICQLNKILPPNSDSENLTEIIVKLVLIDDFELIPSNLFPKYNHCTVFIGENLQKILNLTDKCKIILNSFLYENSDDASEIQIQPISNLENVNFENFAHNFKLFVLERSKNIDLVLTSNTTFKISDSLNCYLKLLPAKIKYLNFNGDILRNVKISVRNDLVDSNKFKLTSLPNQNTDLKIDFIYLEKFQKAMESGVKTLKFGLKLFEEKQWDTSIQNVLISGQTGSGKSTLGKLICQKLLDETNFVYTKILDCKALKGKKSETIQKLLIQHFDECLYYQPSIIFLDDLDIICGTQSESSEGIISSETNYFNKMSEMLCILLKTYQSQNFIAIIATVKSKNNLNKFLYNPRGNHLFSTHLETPILENNDRKEIMKHILQEISSNTWDQLVKNEEDLHDFSLQTEGYVFQDFIDFKNKCIFESMKRDEAAQKESKYNIQTRDVENALKNVIPISFHDINLQKSSCRKWDEIGGLHSAKEALIETIQWPNLYPEIFSTCPIRLQTGILIYGHPGTGKTILAGAAAQYFGLRLISIKGPELLSKYIGASEESVRNIFQKAQSAKPCILFFDEFDSLAPRRGHDSTGVTDRVVNQLLTQLDGVETLDGVYVMAATSRPDLIDPALLRPGRLGRQIHCPLPNPTDRLDILKLLSKNLTLADDISLNEISKATKGFTGADLQAILCTAQLSAIEDVINSKDNKTEISVQISQRHLLNSLKQTRPSLSVEEKARYDKIYAVFQGKEEKSKGAIRKQKVTLA
ncbi:peroxisome biogenesis factor 1 [Chrysoperla carnea]|uniref:peroxisome biogenesis factor 1 n=1 Tax=Chrysoperla carnea TaxID=189513 RepID=UPI001D08C122|nr:peroxisome biogenesis factor 1 [Chrysoperla carnea]